MARAIQQIKQDLVALEEKVAIIADDLRSLYIQYLNLFCKSVQNQLVLASYKICTQTYPKSFLSLSFSQRQKVQQNLRQIAKQIENQLISSLNDSKQLVTSEQDNVIEQMLKKLPIIQEEEGEKEEEEERKEEEEEERKEEGTLFQSEIKNLNELTAENLKNITDPKDLLKWQKKLEEAINKSLEKSSVKANSILQKNNVLPQKFPAKLLEIAMQADESTSGVSPDPNLLSIMVETKKEEKSKKSSLTDITAICLRLSEIEFADPILSLERNKIRNLLNHILKIEKKYEKIKQELEVAEAEAAWRSSWYED